MKTYDFGICAYETYGIGNDWDWTYTLTDEEASVMEAIASELTEDDDLDMSEYPEVADIYNRILDEVLEDQADIYLEDADLLELIADYFGYEENEDGEYPDVTRKDAISYLTSTLNWIIYFPSEPIQEAED